MAVSRRWMALMTPVAVLMVVMSTSAPLARGQEADAPHPAHIHSGSCDNLGDIVAPLTDVTELTAGEVFGAESAILVKESETDVALPLGDILAAPHAINMHESAEAIQNYIACGDIGGRVIDGDLVIGLRELNGSGHHGVAVLEADDDGTDVYVYLAEEGTGAEAEQDAGHRHGPRGNRRAGRAAAPRGNRQPDAAPGRRGPGRVRKSPSISATSPTAPTRSRSPPATRSPGRTRMRCRTRRPVRTATCCNPGPSRPEPASVSPSRRPASSGTSASFTRT